MVHRSETDVLGEICKEAKKEGKLTGRNLTELYEIFGQRFTKAFEALKENRVKKYSFKPSGKTVWIVVGNQRDYLVMAQAGFCTCDDFYFRVLEREIHVCYHLIAQRIAAALGWYESINEADELYENLMNEWKKPTA